MEEIAAAAAPAPVLWDLSPLRRRGPGRARAARHGAGRRLHLQVPERRPGRARLPLRARGAPDRLRTPIQGWFGQRDQFAMERPYDPAPGVRALPRRHPADPRAGGGRGGRQLVGEAGIGDLRDKAAALTELLVAMHDERLAPLGFRLASPRDPARRGAHVSLAHDDAWADLPSSDRARQGLAGLPQAGLDSARRAAALHALHRRLRRARSPARRWWSVAITATSTAGRCG